MAELVEGARLEIVYTGNRIKGSNPFLSATPRKTPESINVFGGFGVFIDTCPLRTYAAKNGVVRKHPARDLLRQKCF